MTAPTVTETLVRVNYSETDQMGVAYHARYLVWLDVARTEHLRGRGASYRELEAAGLRLVVSEVSVRYRQPARFDDLLRIRCWVRGLESREIDVAVAVAQPIETLRREYVRARRMRHDRSQAGADPGRTRALPVCPHGEHVGARCCTHRTRAD